MSNETKHAPGSWSHHIGNTRDIVEDAKGDLVAVVYDGRNSPSCTMRPRQTANARLIAASPDLLEALLEAREVLAVALSWPGSESLRSKINVAIMKTEAAQRVPERRHVGDYELYDRGCPDCP